MERQTNREYVVATAAELFLRRGIANTSMDDVVRESGVAKSNIYYHFKSKDSLLAAVVDHQVQIFEKTVVEPVLKAPSPTVIEGLKRYVTSLAAELSGRDCVGGCPFITLAIQAAGTSLAVRERITRFFTDQTIRLAALIDHGIRQGEVRPDLDPSAVAGLILSAIEGSLFLAELTHEVALLERRLFVLLDLLRPIP